MTRFLAPTRSVRPRFRFIPMGEEYFVHTGDDPFASRYEGKWLKGRAVEVMQ